MSSALGLAPGLRVLERQAPREQAALEGLACTAGPGDQQWEVQKGTVAAGKATFEVQQPDGPLFKFTLAIVDGRLQGEMTGEREGVVRGRAKIDAARAGKK